MYTVNVFEAKIHFPALLERVLQGEEVLITNDSQVVAKLVPMIGVDRQEAEDVIQNILSFQSSHTLALDWKKLRNEGRK